MIRYVLLAVLLGLFSCGDCTGDCDGDGTVTQAEVDLVAYLNVTRLNLDDLPPGQETCEAADSDGNRRISIGELQETAYHAENGCPTPEAGGE